MKLARRRLLRLFAGAAVLPTASRMAAAETFPSRPISIVVPFPAGGPTDTLGRILADRMERALGQSVIVEDLTGAAGTVGGARRLHAHSRPLANPRRQQRHLRAAVRRGERFRAGFADRGLSNVGGWQ
jgi:hypothetical protein